MNAKNDAIAALLDLEDTLNFVASREVVEACRKGFTVTQKAIEALAAENAQLRKGDVAEAPEKAKAAEAARFAQLKAEFAKHGHALTCSVMVAELFDRPVSYMVEGEGRARWPLTLADVEAFLLELKGTV